MISRLLAAGLVAGALGACGGRPGPQPIFVDGRAVTAVGDSLLAFTRAGGPGVLLYHRRTGVTDTLGSRPGDPQRLLSPLHIEFHERLWYVSNVEEGRPSIVILTVDGAWERAIPLTPLAATPNQFAVLPDGRIIVEIPGGQLLALAGDTTATFATFRPGPKSGLLVGASGGVLHALPDRHITLYNQFGNIRWRIEWPWRETAFITDLSVDANGRIHVIAGVPSEGTFIVYTLASENGEVVRWSVPGPHASFTVDHLGEIRPDPGSGPGVRSDPAGGSAL